METTVLIDAQTPDKKPLTKSDFETGMIFEKQLAEAYQAFVETNNAYLAYMKVLRQRYNAPDGEWKLTDWAEGFVRGEDGKQDN